MTPSFSQLPLHTVLAEFNPSTHVLERWLALFAATIASSDGPVIEEAIVRSHNAGVDRTPLYEIVLQSYLFLGFPRMLTAAEVLGRVLPESETPVQREPISEVSPSRWISRGTALCKQVYGENYDALKSRVESIAPEVFEWMILEGYGKVLSRPALAPTVRELATIAMLLVDNREQQLHSHLRGAINVGTSPDLVSAVVDDLSVFQEGHATARQLLTRMKVR